MGWCQAFGPQIQPGCDHSMVAGPNSCSCPQCGVVCKGKFAGCTAVWAAGPQQVTLRRPKKDAGQRSLPELVATNGNRSHEAPPRDPISLPPTPTAPSTDVTADLRPLLLELQSAIEGLPNRISRAAAEAMRQQHTINRRDLEDLWRTIANEAEMLRRRPEQPVSTTDLHASMQAFDDRFQWLVNELSERFVLFGNELARIEKRLDPATNGTAATNGHAEQRSMTQPRAD